MQSVQVYVKVHVYVHVYVRICVLCTCMYDDDDDVMVDPYQWEGSPLAILCVLL